MPSHRKHRLLDKLILKKQYPHVHRWMDKPYKLLGKKHRKLRHSEIELFLRFGASKEFIAGLLHIYLDNAYSKKRKIRK